MDRRRIFCGLLGLFFTFSIGVARAYNIQDEINAASPGDTINIPDGTYTESVDVPDTLPGLIILGQSRDGTVVTNTSGSGFVIAADNVTIKNLTVKGYTTGRGIDFISFGTITSGLIDNITADGNGDGISIDGVTATDFKIQNSQIINNNYSPSGIYINDSSNIQITNNQITGNSNGVDLAGTTSNITLSNNTFGTNSLYDIYNNTINGVTATGNNWGGVSYASIQTRIYDRADDASLGLVIIDNTLPSVNAGPDKITNASFTQEATASDTYGVSSYYWEKVSGPGTVTFDNTAVEDPNVSASSDGDYLIKLTVTDTSGNTNSDTFELTWDTTAPTGFWTAPASGETISGSTTLAATASDSLSGIDSVKFQYKRNDGRDTFHSTPSIWDTTALALDEYTLRAVVTDNAGNITTIDRTVYVAAVITGFTHFTIDTNRIQVDWTTDRPTDGHVVYDTHSHSSVDEYAFSSGTIHLAPDYSTSHSIIIGGLADNTPYYFRAVSAGTPVTVSEQGGNKTFTVTGGGGGGGSGDGGGGGGTITPPATLFPAQFIPVEEILGEATQSAEIFPTPIPEIAGTKIETQNEWPWWSIITLTSVFGLGISWWIIRKK